MYLKCIFFVVLVISLTITKINAADLPSGSTEPADYIQTCIAHGKRFISIPGTDACIRLSGDARGRIQFIKAETEDGKMDFNGRARMALDARRLTLFGDARTFMRLKVETNDMGSAVSGESGFVQIGDLAAGYASSFGNINYGDYALNANNGWLYTDNTVPMIGYSLNLESLNTMISLSLEKPTGNALYIPDLGAGIEFTLGEFAIGVGGGGVYHFFKEGEYQQNYIRHRDYTNLTETEKNALAEPSNLNTFGFYGGGGIKIPIPGLRDALGEPTTYIGATGLYSNATLSKIGIPEVTFPDRIAECKGENCMKVENAGRPTRNDVTIAVSRNDYSASGFDKSTLDMVTLFKEDAFLGSLDVPEENKGYLQEVKSNSGFTAQGGLSHKFSSSIGIAANGGIFSATEGDWSVFGIQAASSLGYSPLDGLTFTIGGDFYSASYSSADEKIQEEIDADETNSIDPNFSVTFEISQSF